MVTRFVTSARDPRPRPSSVSASVRWSVADAPGAPGAPRLDAVNLRPAPRNVVWRARPESAGVDGPLVEGTVSGPPYRCRRAPRGGVTTPSVERVYARVVIPGLHHRVVAAAGALVVALLAAACSAGAGTLPVGSCTDGTIQNSEPALEALLPATFEGRAPDALSSGRNCTAETLGSLTEHGVTAFQFAGATWDFGAGTAATFAIEALPDQRLPAAWVEEFYERGARGGRRTGDIQVSRPTVAPIGEVYRLDVLNDLSLQTIVVWADGNRVRDVLVATPVSPTAVRAQHDGLVDRAVAAALSSPP